jgi:hypothetical protein
MIGLILALIVVGVVLWLVETVIPLDSTVRQIIRVVIVLAVIVFLLGYARSLALI